MCKKHLVLRKKKMIILIIFLFIFSGCGESESIKVDTDASLTEMDVENNELIADLPKKPEVSLNTNAEDIHYYSEDGIDLLRAMHRCVSDGKNIYLVHGEPDLYIMPIGTDEHYPANIDNPEGMDVCNIAIDQYGFIHLLMAGQENEKWFIWRLDEDYQVDKVMDISIYFETKQMPLWFLIDEDGSYYFQWTNDRNGMIVDREGMLKHKFTPEALEAGWIYEAAVGKDGQIYLAYDNQNEQIKIGRLEYGRMYHRRRKFDPLFSEW